MVLKKRDDKGSLVVEQVVAIGVASILFSSVVATVWAVVWLVRTAPPDVPPTLFSSMSTAVSRLEQRLVPPVVCDNPPTRAGVNITQSLCLQIRNLDHSPVAAPGSPPLAAHPDFDSRLDYDIDTYRDIFFGDVTGFLNYDSENQYGFSERACWQTRPNPQASEPDTRRLECWQFEDGKLVIVYYAPVSDDEPAGAGCDADLPALINVPQPCWDSSTTESLSVVATGLVQMRWSKHVDSTDNVLYRLTTCAEVRELDRLAMNIIDVPRCGEFVTDETGLPVRHPDTGNPLVCSYQPPGVPDPCDKGTTTDTDEAGQFDLRSDGAGIIASWDTDDDGVADSDVMRRPCFNLDGSTPVVRDDPVTNQSALTAEELDRWWVCYEGYRMPPLRVTG